MTKRASELIRRLKSECFTSKNPIMSQMKIMSFNDAERIIREWYEEQAPSPDLRDREAELKWCRAGFVHSHFTSCTTPAKFSRKRAP